MKYLILTILSIHTLFLPQTRFSHINELGNNCSNGDMSSCQKIIDIATSGSDFLLREEAIYFITNQTVLEKIAKTDEHYRVRISAIKKLTQANALTEIARTDDRFDVRLTAIQRINQDDNSIKNLNDENMMADIAIHFGYTNFTIEAVNNIKNQDILLEVAQNARTRVIRCIAINRLDGQKYYNDIIEIIKSAKDDEVYYNVAAVGTIKILPYEKSINNYYKRIDTKLKINHKHQEYYGAKWRIIEYIINIKTNRFKKKYHWSGIKGKHIEKMKDIRKIHEPTILLDKILNDLLSKLSSEELMDIANESELVFIRKTAQVLLGNEDLL